MCWISGTNPAVSFVNLEKMRSILGMPGLFVIAQDIFETETTQLADVVLPAAMWGEKTGCFTNVGTSILQAVSYEPHADQPRLADARPYRSPESQGDRASRHCQGEWQVQTHEPTSALDCSRLQRSQSDLEIFLDYARRMDFKDKDGKPLLPFHDSKSAFEHWRSTTVGRPCDYTGMSYDKLTGGSGMQWPCNAETSPNGTERLVSPAVDNMTSIGFR